MSRLGQIVLVPHDLGDQFVHQRVANLRFAHGGTPLDRLHQQRFPLHHILRYFAQQHRNLLHPRFRLLFRLGRLLQSVHNQQAQIRSARVLLVVQQRQRAFVKQLQQFLVLALGQVPKVQRPVHLVGLVIIPSLDRRLQLGQYPCHTAGPRNGRRRTVCGLCGHRVQFLFT